MQGRICVADGAGGVLKAACGLYFSVHRGWLVHQVGRGLVNAGINHGSFGEIDLQ